MYPLSRAYYCNVLITDAFPSFTEYIYFMNNL